MFLQTAHNPRPSAYFAVLAFKDVVRPYATPVFMWEVEISQRFRHTLVVKLGGRLQPHITQFLFHIGGLFQRRLLVFLGVCCL